MIYINICYLMALLNRSTKVYIGPHTARRNKIDQIRALGYVQPGNAALAIC
jgi:hypothetical protein